MDQALLSRLSKDFLNLDSALVPPKDRYRRGWGGSVLVSHRGAQKRSLEKKKAAEHLLALRERLNQLFSFEPPPTASLPMSPRLSQPTGLPLQASFQPPVYFSKGISEQDRRKYPEPIPYLLAETCEWVKPRPVPGNSFLFRSLCKGKGVLKQNQWGLVYLDVDNQFISMLLPYLKAQALVRPPYFHLFGSPDGAHVPVIPSREVAFQYLSSIEGLGQEFSFTIEGLYSMEPSSWPEVEQVWFFKVQSESLENFRRGHFLPSLPGGNSFHIAVAVKPRVTATRYPRTLATVKINPCFTAA